MEQSEMSEGLGCPTCGLLREYCKCQHNLGNFSKKPVEGPFLTWELESRGSFVEVDYEWQMKKIVNVLKSRADTGRVEGFRDPTTGKFVVTQYFMVIKVVNLIEGAK